jgi:predicted N-acyltransferase
VGKDSTKQQAVGKDSMNISFFSITTSIAFQNAAFILKDNENFLYNNNNNQANDNFL